jgi:hypothetical protein
MNRPTQILVFALSLLCAYFAMVAAGYRTPPAATTPAGPCGDVKSLVNPNADSYTYGTPWRDATRVEI